MTKVKRKSWYELHPTPAGEQPVSSRGGCKVSWKTYATEQRAREMAAWAYLEGEYKAALGYDYGYCMPGSVAKVDDGWEVCFA